MLTANGCSISRIVNYLQWPFTDSVVDTFTIKSVISKTNFPIQMKFNHSPHYYLPITLNAKFFHPSLVTCKLLYYSSFW